MLALLIRTSRGFTSIASSQRQRMVFTESSRRYLSDRRLSEWDHLFFEDSDSADSPEVTPAPSPPTRQPVPNRSESTDQDFGAYDYDPSEDPFPDMDTNFFPVDDAPPQSAAWDEPPKQEKPKVRSVAPRARDVAPKVRAVAPKASSVQSSLQSAPWDEITVPQEPAIPAAAPMNRIQAQLPTDREPLITKASNGGPIDTNLEKMEMRLKELEQTIYTENAGKEFNINSPKQVSMALFGNSGQSTNKETLEAMGGAGNRMADLVLQYRKLKQDIKRAVRKEENTVKGTQINDFSKSQAQQQQQEEVPKQETKTTIDEEFPTNDPLLLVDASAYIFRAYYSMPAIHRHDGMPVGAVMGFCNMLNRLMLTRVLAGDCPRLVLVFDPKGKNFRHDLYDKYKANRPPCPVDLVPQFDLIREAAKAYGIPEVEATGFEADDVIATLATLALKEGIDTHILSGDKDLMQLVTAPDMAPYVHMIDPMSMSRVDHDVVQEKWGVPPELIGDILALAGDSADNIPGVPGIGPKIAAALLEEFGSLSALYEGVEQVKLKGRREKLVENKHLAMLSRQLVELDRAIPTDKMTTVPIDMIDVSTLRMEPMNGDRLLAFYDEMGFRELKRRVENRLSQKETKKPMPKKKASSWTPRTKATIPRPEDYADVPF